MLNKVANYYRSILNRLGTEPEKQYEDGVSKYAYHKNLVTGFGTLIYNMEQNGFYGIVDDNNNLYLPINNQDFSHILQDRKRVQFTLNVYPDVCNIYRWGKTAKVIAIQILG